MYVIRTVPHLHLFPLPNSFHTIMRSRRCHAARTGTCVFPAPSPLLQSPTLAFPPGVCIESNLKQDTVRDTHAPRPPNDSQSRYKLLALNLHQPKQLVVLGANSTGMFWEEGMTFRLVVACQTHWYCHWSVCIFHAFTGWLVNMA